MIEITTRSFNPETDTNLILKSWLTTFKNTGPAVHRMIDSEYFEDYQKIIKHMLANSDITIVCDPEDKDIIWAYMIHTDHAIHYIYVKDTFRKLGIMRKLISLAKANHFTHWTTPMNSISHKFKHLIYNPFKI